MHYFALVNDYKTTNPLNINIEEKAIMVTDAIITYCDFDNKTVPLDFFCIKKLFNHYYFVSDKLKDLIEIYDESIEFIPFIVTNKKLTRQIVFWRIIFKNNIFVFDNKINNLDELKLDNRVMKNKYIFSVKFQKQEYICVSLILAENMLRKFLIGIDYKEVFSY